jgi:hypothetical protein
MNRLLFFLFFICGACVQVANAQAPVTVSPDGAQVRLTVTQADQSLVSDRRTVNLAAGRNLVRFTGVAARLDPNSVQPLISGGGTVEILEQRFRNEAGTTEKTVLRRYIGQPVTLVRPDQPVVKGTLLAVDEVVVLDTSDGLMVNPQGTFVVPRSSDTMSGAPALEWLVNAPTAGQYAVEARYGTAGLEWRASYRASLDASGERLTLRGWLAVNNDSGADFRQAQMALQIGQSGQATRVWKFPRPVDLTRRESRQLPFITVADLPVTQDLVFYAAESQPDFTKPYSGAPQLMVRLRNSTDIGLGVPLPAGPLTVWGIAQDGSLRRLAQKELPFTDPDRRLWISLGPAPGVSASRIMTNSRQLNPVTREYTVQITLRNDRQEPVTVSVIEQLPANAKISESSVPSTTLEPNVIEFKPNVSADSSVVLKYVVEVRG